MSNLRQFVFNSGTKILGGLITGTILLVSVPVQGQDPVMETSSSVIRVEETTAGFVMEFRLPEVAPFPDESRREGFTRRNGQFVPFEGHYDDSTVLVFVSHSAVGTDGDRIPVLLHFHGHLNTARNAFETQQWGEQIAASGLPLVMILPQGPKNAADSSIGKLERPDGFQNLLGAVEEELARVGPLAEKGKRLGSVILSGHSGGYLAVSYGLEVGGLDPQRIVEVWLLDAAYGRLKELAAGVSGEHGSRRLRSIFTAHLQQRNIELMDLMGRQGRLSRVVVEANPEDQPQVDAALAGFDSVFLSTAEDHTGLISSRGFVTRLLLTSSLSVTGTNKN